MPSDDHPADCLFCAAGEAMRHTYEPPTGDDRITDDPDAPILGRPTVVALLVLLALILLSAATGPATPFT